MNLAANSGEKPFQNAVSRHAARSELCMTESTLTAVPKLYDVITWLVGRVEKFPRSQKFTLGDRIVNLALDILELLIEATYTRDRLPLLRRANIQLEKLRYLIRLSHDFKLLSTKQYRHISGEINEVGKRIGGWIKSQTRRK